MGGYMKFWHLILFGALMALVPAALVILRIDSGPVLFMLYAIVIVGICIYAFTQRGAKDEFQWAGFRWARAWGSLAASLMILVLYYGFYYAPAETAPLKGFFLSFMHRPGHEFECGMITAFWILLAFWVAAMAVWRVRHR